MKALDRHGRCPRVLVPRELGRAVRSGRHVTEVLHAARREPRHRAADAQKHQNRIRRNRPVQAVRLPYAGDAAMVIALPKGGTPSDLAAALDPDDLDIPWDDPCRARRAECPANVESSTRPARCMDVGVEVGVIHHRIRTPRRDTRPSIGFGRHLRFSPQSDGSSGFSLSG